MRRVITTALVLAMAGLATTARADGPAGKTCAAGLTTDGKAIYATVAASNPTSETLKSLVEHETRALAMDGKIGREEARANAMAAGTCLKAHLQ